MYSLADQRGVHLFFFLWGRGGLELVIITIIISDLGQWGRKSQLLHAAGFVCVCVWIYCTCLV